MSCGLVTGVQMCALPISLNQGALIIALRNLGENAALHGQEHGVVTVDAEQEGFAIKDRGGGIAPEDAAKMLEPFVRGPATNLPGSGLGLAIAASALAPQMVLAFERSDDGFCVRASPVG